MRCSWIICLKCQPFLWDALTFLYAADWIVRPATCVHNFSALSKSVSCIISAAPCYFLFIVKLKQYDLISPTIQSKISSLAPTLFVVYNAGDTVRIRAHATLLYLFFPTCVTLPSLCFYTVFVFHPLGVPHLVSEALLVYQKHQRTTHCAQATDADFMLLFRGNNSYGRPHTPTLSTDGIKWL